MTARASDDSVRSGHHVCLVVPNGTYRPDGLARALRRSHDDVEVGAIWCGDPHLRPADGDVEWWDAGPFGGSLPMADDEWHQILLGAPPQVAEWRRSLAVVRGLLALDVPSVTLLWTGAVAVLGDVSALWRDSPRLGLVPRITTALPDDGALPDANDLAAAGTFSAHVVTFGQGSIEVVAWLDARLADAGDDGRFGVCRWLELAAAAFDARICDDESIGVGAWRWDSGRPVLLDVPGYDPTAPWVLDRHVEGRSRVTIVGHPERVAALAKATDQLSGERHALSAPGGLRLDAAMRRVVRRATSPPPSPWVEPAAFRDWLGDRYWTELHASRRDLAVAFPRPATTDAAAFVAWSRRAVVDDDVSLLVPPLSPGSASSSRFEVAEHLRHDGLNLVGYLRRESSLGDVARRVRDSLAAATVPTALLAHERTASPLMPDAGATSRRIEFATTLAVVNADQFATLELDHPELTAATRRMVGYWFWELEHIPRAMRAVIPMVDEIWAGSRFVTDAFARVASVPVRHVPIPVARPQTSGRARTEFEALRTAGDRFVFAVVLDHFSVTERKNPVGAITAFRHAFAPEEGPLLVIKTMNGQRRWPQHQEVLAAAEGRADIVVWDDHLTRPDHMAFIAAVDALVSLHRSEGLGLHLAEAMWLGTPTIATRYSGNLDFMDDRCAMLVDAEPIPVTGGEGVYPADAVWADPDLDLAAECMRRLAGDPELRARLSGAGRAKMEAQPSLADTGRLVAELLHLDRTSSPHT